LHMHEIFDGLEKEGSFHGQHLVLEMPVAKGTFWRARCRG
jgi:hypothetical protein